MLVKYLTKNKYTKWLSIILWAAISFYGSQLIISLLIFLLNEVGFKLSFSSEVILTLSLTVIVYIGTILALILGPKYIAGIKTTKTDLGIDRLPVYKDFLYVILGLLAYVPLTMMGSILAQILIPGYDVNQTQNVGFESVNGSLERAAGFLLLVILAPFVEELIFRGWLFGKLRKYKMPLILTIIIVSVLFGLAHGQLNVAVDVTILSTIMCVLRYKQDSIWPGVFMHMIKNGVAFYFLFVDTTLINSIRG